VKQKFETFSFLNFKERKIYGKTTQILASHLLNVEIQCPESLYEKKVKPKFETFGGGLPRR